MTKLAREVLETGLCPKPSLLMENGLFSLPPNLNGRVCPILDEHKKSVASNPVICQITPIFAILAPFSPQALPFSLPHRIPLPLLPFSRKKVKRFHRFTVRTTKTR